MSDASQMAASAMSSAVTHVFKEVPSAYAFRISSGATLAAIAKKLPDLEAGTRVLGFNYDTGERYLSTWLFEEA